METNALEKKKERRAKLPKLNEIPDGYISVAQIAGKAEHGYSLNNISWMAAPIDFVPVQFHEYGICHSDGEELHFVRQGKRKDSSIYDSVQEVKHREQKQLAKKAQTSWGEGG